jgi:transcriptional regulator with XRE-family HTH domain
MIKNERQYRLTRSQLDRFRGVLDELRERPVAKGEELRRQVELAAVDAQVRELTAELEEYDNLRTGKADVGPIDSLDDLPRVLIRARIASGLTQRDLAERLGMPEQQVQRYEANDWSTASLGRLREVAKVLGIAIRPSIPDPGANDIDRRRLRHHLEQAGLDPAFIERRLTPGGIEAVDDPSEPGVVLDLAARLHRIYGWSPSTVLAGGDLDVEMPTAAGFKLPKRANEPRVRAYSVYAHYIAHLGLDATRSLKPKDIPTSAQAFREAVINRFGSLDFESVLRFAWELGIVVVPLADPGAFHAVVWRVGGRNAIVLKQQTRSLSRWLFDLLHEIYHAGANPDAQEYAVIDDASPSTEEDEVAANAFAGDVVLAGRAEELAQEAVTAAKGRLEFLKSAAPRVARRNGVKVDDLANYLAYRLSLQGENWWGAAANLQHGGPDPWETARDAFLRHADLHALNPLDCDLLTQALEA